MTHQPHNLKAKYRRRGSAYALVLGAGTLLTVCGITVLTIARLQGRVVLQNDDGAEAAVLAEAAVEQAIARIAEDSQWRATYTHNTLSTAQAVGRGTMQFKLVDQVDTDLSNNAAHDVRVYGVGKVKNATRVYSVLLKSSGGPLDLLKTSAHSGGKLTLSGLGTITTIGGPFSTNDTFKLSTGSILDGSAEGVNVDIALGGIILNGSTSQVSTKAMPAADVWDGYYSSATSIPWASITGGNLEKCLLSPGANPYNTSGGGAGNGTGVYHIRVPANGTLNIQNCRLVATLLITLDAGGKLMLPATKPVAWDPPRTDYPSLLVKTSSSNTITFNGSITNLSESNLSVNTNLNPTHTPYPYNASGSTDTDKTDSYPAEFHGLMHIIGTGATINFQSNFKAKGIVIIDGDATIKNGTRFTYDSALYSTPPTGYTGAGSMTPYTASYRWESAQ